MAEVKTIRALSRGLAVIRALEGGASLTLHQLHAATGLPKPTLLRILTTLERDGYVRRGIGDELYRTTVRPAATASDHDADLLADVAAPVLDRLCQRTVWPSDLGVYRDGAMRIHETTRRNTPFVINRKVLEYKIHVLHSAMGRAYLAACDEAERAAIHAVLRASSDPRDRIARRPGAVEALVEQTRAQGYALRARGYSLSPRSFAEMSAIAVPVLCAGRPVGAVNLVWISSAVSEAVFVREQLDALKEAAGEIASEFAARSAGPHPAAGKERVLEVEAQ